MPCHEPSRWLSMQSNRLPRPFFDPHSFQLPDLTPIIILIPRHHSDRLLYLPFFILIVIIILLPATSILLCRMNSPQPPCKPNIIRIKLTLLKTAHHLLLILIYPESPLHPLPQPNPALLTKITRKITPLFPPIRTVRLTRRHSIHLISKVFGDNLMPTPIHALTVPDHRPKTLQPTPRRVRLRTRRHTRLSPTRAFPVDVAHHPSLRALLVFARVEDDARGRLAVAARAAGFLHELLQALGHAHVQHESDGRDVDAHAEGGGGDDDVEGALERGGGFEGGGDWGRDEGFLDGGADVRVQTCVVGGGADGVGLEFCGEGGGGGAGGDVYYACYWGEDWGWDGSW